MSKINNTYVIDYAICIFAFLLESIGYLMQRLDIMLIGIMLMLITNLLYGILEFKNRNLFFVFNITFFVLLLGRKFIYFFSGETWFNNAYTEIEKNTLLLIFISLFFIYIGALLFDALEPKILKDKLKNKKSKKELNITQYRKILRIIAYLSLIAAFFVVIEKSIFVLKYSYVTQVEFQTKIPFIVQKLANMQLITMYLYLCTFPKKKETYIFSICYVIFLVLSIFTGVRGNFVIGLITLLIYYICRQYNFNEKYFTKKSLIVIVIIVIISIIFLSSYNVLRNHKTIENFNPIKQFKQFFIDQATSGEVITQAQKFEKELKVNNNNYTFGIIIDEITNKTYNTKEELALYGNNLGSTVSYYTLNDGYIKGYGIGTQYIAELYTDFSYVGVIIYNTILGFVMIGLLKLINGENTNNIIYAMDFCLIYYIVYLPRQFAMGWINFFISFSVILPIIGAIILKNLLMEEKHENTLDS